MYINHLQKDFQLLLDNILKQRLDVAYLIIIHFDIFGMPMTEPRTSHSH